MRPSAYYHRRALRETNDVERLREIGLHLTSELEKTKAWIREHGLVPPKFAETTIEAAAKGRIGQADADVPLCDDCDDGCEM